MQKPFEVGDKVKGNWTGRIYIIKFSCHGTRCSGVKECTYGSHTHKYSYICERADGHPLNYRFQFICISHQNLTLVGKHKRTFGEAYAEAF